MCMHVPVCVCVCVWKWKPGGARVAAFSRCVGEEGQGRGGGLGKIMVGGQAGGRE